MTNIIKNFAQKANKIGNRNLFNKGASLEKIAEFETKFGIKLPPLVAEFYQQFDGGCFASEDYTEQELKDLKRIPHIVWNSNYFISLDELISGEYFNIDEVYKETGQKFFPIIFTSNQEVLVMKNGETQIFDAFHEYDVEDWDTVYDSFEKLLKDYIDNDGDIETM